MRSELDERLEELNREMTGLGMLCETAIRRSAEALLAHDTDAARHVPELLELVNQKHREIESLCMRLLLRQQPVANDLRMISSALKMVTDMNRIGVQSADIAEIVTMDGIGDVDGTLPLREMAEDVIHMVTASIDAFVKRDIEIARSVIAYDDRVDSCFREIRRRLVDELKDSGESGEKMLDLLMIAKYLERIGDHAVNIAKWVCFSVTGQQEEL